MYACCSFKFIINNKFLVYIHILDSALIIFVTKIRQFPVSKFWHVSSFVVLALCLPRSYGNSFISRIDIYCINLQLYAQLCSMLFQILITKLQIDIENYMYFALCLNPFTVINSVAFKLEHMVLGTCKLEHKTKKMLVLGKFDVNLSIAYIQSFHHDFR